MMPALLLSAATLTLPLLALPQAASVTLSDHTVVTFEMIRSGPPAARPPLTAMVAGASAEVRRLLVDRAHGTYFGYVIRPVRLPDGRQFRVEVAPLDDAGQAELSRSLDAARCENCSSAVVRFPAPQVFADGEAFLLELMTNPRTGEKLTDIVRVASSAKASVPGREGRLRMVGAVIRVNGEPVPGNGSCRGDVVYFYVRGKGRFVITPEPVAGLALGPASLVDNRTVAFQAGGDRFEWTSQEPIAAEAVASTATLWVWHDASYRPSFDPDVAWALGAARHVLDLR